MPCPTHRRFRSNLKVAANCSTDCDFHARFLGKTSRTSTFHPLVFMNASTKRIKLLLIARYPGNWNYTQMHRRGKLGILSRARGCDAFSARTEKVGLINLACKSVPDSGSGRNSFWCLFCHLQGPKRYEMAREDLVCSSYS